jgi:hypothetical protein
MVTEWALLISMPAEPETTPELEMPPVKREAMIAIPVPTAEIFPALLIPPEKTGP